jgi:hypothetical protein
MTQPQPPEGTTYEEYAATCGGRVTTYAMPYCTDLG